MARVASSLRDLVKKSDTHISKIMLSKSEDLVCRNMFCDKVSLPCLCRLEQAVCYADLTRVTHLDLSANKLSELPPSLKLMTNLEFLDLSDNRLKALPRSLLENRQLKEIRLSGNEFRCEDRELPVQFSDLQQCESWLFLKEE
mmetsp:Transcript_24701/g.41766  ORF Transcript_24701/g.41766 Transcript_24701/m.41766 type:complete len:143 (-) Transcript_24701:253-681(-)